MSIYPPERDYLAEEKAERIENKLKEPTMNIKDYLHLYLGCEVLCYEPELCINDRGLLWQINSFGSCRIGGNERIYPIPIVKPIIRPLSDMTSDEAHEGNIWALWHDVNNMGEEWETSSFTPKQFIYLLSKHFDLFGLIDAGLAIDKTTIK